MNMDHRLEELEQLYVGVPISSDDIILDALCGNGFASKPLIGRTEKIFGVDRKERPKDFPQEITYSRQAIQSLDFTDETFTLVLAHAGFHHVGQGNPIEQQQAVNEFYRILQPGGIVRLADLEGGTSASHLNDDYMPSHGKNCVWLTPNYAATLLTKAGFIDVNAESIPIRWNFVNHSQLDKVAQSMFRVDKTVLQKYGLVRNLTITLPFMYARGVKR